MHAFFKLYIHMHAYRFVCSLFKIKVANMCIHREEHYVTLEHKTSHKGQFILNEM